MGRWTMAVWKYEAAVQQRDKCPLHLWRIEDALSWKNTGADVSLLFFEISFCAVVECSAIRTPTARAQGRLLP